MGIIGNLIQKATDAIYNKVTNDGVNPASYLIKDQAKLIERGVVAEKDAEYAKRWYQLFPYEFMVAIGESGGSIDSTVSDFSDAGMLNQISKAAGSSVATNGKLEFCHFTLPIPPESMSVTMISASQVTPTLGGVVEETSENMIWQIQLSGTPGLSTSRTDSTQMNSSFRQRVTTTGLLSGVMGALNSLDNLDNSLGGAGDDFDASSAGDAIDTGLQMASAALLPKLIYSRSAVSGERNGFVEINELHDFLLAYSSLKEQEPNKYRLYFIDHKNMRRWRVAVQGGLQISKTVQDPMLYRYGLTLIGWALHTPGQFQRAPLDRFKTDLKPVNILTVTGAYVLAKQIQIDIIKASKNPGGYLNSLVPPII